MKKDKRRVGAGLTVYEDVRTSYEMDKPGEEQLAKENLEQFFSDPFESAFGKWVEAARRDLAVYRARAEPGHRFAEHAEPGWYCEEIIERDRFARQQANAGNVEWAMFHAAHLGHLLAEARVKFHAEPMWQKGVEATDARSRGGGANRKHPDHVYLESYRSHRTTLGKSDATDMAAQDLGVSRATIRNARKRAGASD